MTGARSRIWGTVAVALATAAMFSAPTANAEELDECIASNERAQQLTEEGKYRAARVELLRCARSVCPGPVRHDCGEWLTKLDADTPTVVFAATDSRGHDLVDVRVTVDGQVVSQRLDGMAVPIDPGARRIRWEARGAPPVEQEILVRTGQKNREISATLPTPIDGSVTPSPRSSTPVVGYGLLGIGVVGVAVGAVFWVRGKSDADEIDAGCAKTLTCDPADVSGAKRSLVIGDLAVGAGLVSGLVGAYLVFMRPSASAKGRTNAGLELAPRFDLVPRPGGAVLGAVTVF